MVSRKTSSTPKLAEVQGFVVTQLEEARKRLASFEEELVSRGRAQQRELESLIERVRPGKELKALEKKATAAGAEAKKRLDSLQGQVLSALGVASHSEIQEIHQELAKLSKKVNQIVAKKSAAKD
jgi:polyhydroxyalkanoate synthesis regulator phasin